MIPHALYIVGKRTEAIFNMKVEFVICLAIQRSIWCVVLHFGINKAIGGNVLLNFEGKIGYLLSSITQLTRILSSSLSAEKSFQRLTFVI